MWPRLWNVPIQGRPTGEKSAEPKLFELAGRGENEAFLLRAGARGRAPNSEERQ